jgi:hypothetical protein
MTATVTADLDARIRGIVTQVRRLAALDLEAVRGVELLLGEAIQMRQDRRHEARTLDARLRRVHPGCDGPFIQQPPHNGRRSWRCEHCRQTFTLPEGRS